MKKFLVALVLFFIFAIPTYAAYDQSPLSLVIEHRDIISPVDRDTWCGDCIGDDYTAGSPWTINPGWVEGYIPAINNPPQMGTEIEDGCLWDSDDAFKYITMGSIISSGQTLIATECRWPDELQQFSAGGTRNYLVFRSPSPNLVITAKWAWDAGEVSYTIPKPTIKDSSNLYLYTYCLRPPNPVGGTTINVPGSHDGDGVYQEITITITNPTNKKINKTGGHFGASLIQAPTYCSEYIQL